MSSNYAALPGGLVRHQQLFLASFFNWQLRNEEIEKSLLLLKEEREARLKLAAQQEEFKLAVKELVLEAKQDGVKQKDLDLAEKNLELEEKQRELKLKDLELQDMNEELDLLKKKNEQLQLKVKMERTRKKQLRGQGEQLLHKNTKLKADLSAFKGSSTYLEMKLRRSSMA